MLHKTIITFITILIAQAILIRAETAMVDSAAAPVVIADASRDTKTESVAVAATETAVPAAKSDSTDNIKQDSIADARRDSIAAAVRAERMAAYAPPLTGDAQGAADAFDRTHAFRGDGAGVSEALRYRSLSSVYVPFTLSSGMNRSLYYGSTAHGWHPVSADAPPILFYMSPPQFHGSDMASATQASDFIFDRLTDGIMYLPYPDAMAAPELHIFWENGVFNQNTLNLRISRPLGRNLMFSAFSDYRYFEGTHFDHERNDIVKFYETFYSDTSRIMNQGYNPLVNEHTVGVALLRIGADSSKIRAGFTYAEAQNEFTLDIPAQSLDRLEWARMSRYTYRIDAALLDKKIWSSRLNLKTAYISEDFKSRYAPDTSLLNASWSGNSNSALFDASVVTPIHAGLRAEGLVIDYENGDGDESLFTEYNAEIFYDRKIQLPRSFWGDVNIRAFAGVRDIEATVNDNDFNFEAGAALDFMPGNGSFLNRRAKLSRLSVYTKTKDITATGAEGLFESKHLGLLLGYRQTNESRPIYVWPAGKPPYDQPGQTILIAPWTARFGGVSLMSKTFLTDTKPYVKTTTVLSHLIQPKGMAHTFETELGYDYWSKRDPITFAGLTDYGWNDPIHDVNLKMTVHIKSFRLFYKIDNILNMRQAYVPGYFSPGLTFRWGINWFLM